MTILIETPVDQKNRGPSCVDGIGRDKKDW